MNQSSRARFVTIRRVLISVASTRQIGFVGRAWMGATSALFRLYACWYEWASVGWSDPGAGSQLEAMRPHGTPNELLINADIKRPFVLVDASFGENIIHLTDIAGSGLPDG